jgi:hypothetical protein
MRLLARIVPFMIESDQPYIRDLFWKRRTQTLDAQQPSDMKSGGGVKDGGGGPPENSPTREVEGEAAAGQDLEPLAVVLVNSAYHLLFLPDFTIEDPNMDFKESDLLTHRFKSALMWAPGVGSPEKTVSGSGQYDKARVDVLRLMVALFSDSLYQRPEAYDSCASLWYVLC